MPWDICTFNYPSSGWLGTDDHGSLPFKIQDWCTTRSQLIRRPPTYPRPQAWMNPDLSHCRMPRRRSYYSSTECRSLKENKTETHRVLNRLSTVGKRNIFQKLVFNPSIYHSLGRRYMISSRGKMGLFFNHVSECSENTFLMLSQQCMYLAACTNNTD